MREKPFWDGSNYGPDAGSKREREWKWSKAGSKLRKRMGVCLKVLARRVVQNTNQPRECFGNVTWEAKLLNKMWFIGTRIPNAK